jgi:hypothetical protein
MCCKLYLSGETNQKQKSMELNSQKQKLTCVNPYLNSMFIKKLFYFYALLKVEVDPERVRKVILAVYLFSG